jgi:hypothetical protein
MLSLALCLADIAFFTTYVIVQDGISLIAQCLEKKVALALLTGFAISSLNIVL